jgi:predicted amidophosphoribosyltransferase
VPFLAQRLALIFQTNTTLQNADKSQIFLSFIPSHRRRKYLEKGYNQSELLAKELAKQLNLPILPLAQKTRYTVSQLKLHRSQRQKNLTEAFIPCNLDLLPPRATVVLVDDVTTTGSTIQELAKTLKKSRPDLMIWGAVIARNMQ